MKITLAGVPGSGKSTLRNKLAERYKLQIKGTGDFMRQAALRYGYHDITKFLVEYVSFHPEIDREVDDEQKLFGETHDDFVLDAHLGFFFVPDSIKFLLMCNPDVAAERILNAHRETESAKNIRAALEANQQRIQTMKNNFKKLYNVDIHDEKNFDCVIDTSHMAPDQALQTMLDFIESQGKP